MLAMMGKINLPVELVILSLAIAFFGFVLVIKRQVFSIKLSEVVAYHVAADLSAIISMVVLHFYVVDISLIETLITGSVLSVLVSAALLFLTFRRSGTSQSASAARTGRGGSLQDGQRAGKAVRNFFDSGKEG